MNSYQHAVIPGRELAAKSTLSILRKASEPGIHNPCRAYGFRAFNTHRLRRRVLNPGMTKQRAV